VLLKILLSIAAALSIGMAQPRVTAPLTVAGVGLPASPGSPTTDQGRSLTFSFVALSIVCNNTDSVSHTITIKDGQTTPFYLYGNASGGYTMPPATTWAMNAQLRFTTGLVWFSDSTNVMCAVVGQ
jgi:hypothetical protein